ncbi:MAG: hypothetical protein IJG33_00735 [Selenomonadaceae bacterium]|nr:hypothetical protein [Selenomonadaceae bacterium]
MKADEIFDNRRVIAGEICRIVGENGGQLANAKYFLERPYSVGEKTYKFSTANYLRLLASNNKAIQECDPRWFSIDEIKNNGWTLREDAQAELLEVWNKTTEGSQEGYLQEFYNARDILEKDSFAAENQELETIINFFQVRGLIQQVAESVSFQDCINAVKKYAEDSGADGLTAILAVQTWIVESRLKTKTEWFLPAYSDSLLAELEKAPDKLFESMNKARAILKKFQREKEMPIAENLSDNDAFHDLKIIYHGSEVELKNRNGRIYRNESALNGATAYEFLCSLKARKEKCKTWMEFSYKSYSHGKFLLSDEIPKGESVSTFLRTRLNKNRQHLLHNPQDLKPYITAERAITASGLLRRINFESKLFESVMDEFESEENLYLESHPELL